MASLAGPIESHKAGFKTVYRVPPMDRHKGRATLVGDLPQRTHSVVRSFAIDGKA